MINSSLKGGSHLLHLSDVQKLLILGVSDRFGSTMSFRQLERLQRSFYCAWRQTRLNMPPSTYLRGLIEKERNVPRMCRKS